MILKMARVIGLDYKIHTGKLKRESSYDILRKKKELPPPGQLQNQTQFIFNRALFLNFFSPGCVHRGVSTPSSSGIADSPPGKVKVFEN